MEPFETFEHEGVLIEVHYDERGGEHADPREQDNLSMMICWHPDYVLGDEQVIAPNGRGAVATFGRESQADAKARLRPLRPESMEHLRRYLGIVRKAVGVRPLYLLDHSGLSIRAGSASPADPGGWDTTHVGYVYTTHERVSELCGDDPAYHSDEWIAVAIEGEVDEYDSYLRGAIYGFVVAPGTEDEDSCWGFLGDPETSGLYEEAKATAEAIARDRRVNAEPRDVAEVLALVGEGRER